jgi:FMN phosphatase YigB (HAD superfamily)
MAIRIVLSDLGKVPLDYDFNLVIKRFSKLSGMTLKRVERVLFIDNDKPWIRFLRGQISNEDFHKLCCDLFNIAVNYNEFREIVCDIFKPNAPVIDLWMKLYGRGYVLVLLSNLDRMQKDWVTKYYKLPPFEIRIWSCDVGCMKPDPKIYEIALDRCRFYLSASPDEIVFVDDVEINVEAARKFAIHAIHYTGDNEKLLAELRALGVKVD